MKVFSGILVVALVAAPAMAATYGWEDGGTILGSYGYLANPLNVTSPVHSGSHALQVSESPIGGTPQAYLAFIEGLTDGDVIDGSFWGWDVTDGGSPSLRIWGHYAVSGDVTSYEGSASGSYTYTSGTPEDPWSQVGYTWTFDSAGGTRDALVIEGRLYSPSGAPDPQDFWIDDIEVTTTSPTATITFPSPDIFGACCDGSDCMITTAADCDYAGLEYQGNFTTCDPNPCGPTGSCCSEDYSCIDDLTVEECAAADPEATWVDGGICAEDCVPPTGSCCLMDGSCMVGVTEDECADMRGRQWTEDAEDCDPACEPAVRAPVIISEYYESAPGYRKALEIFNTTPEPVSLYGHALVLYANASTIPTGVFLLDDLTIGGYEAMVFINRASDDIPNFDEATAIIAPSVCNFNGDDAVAILFEEIDSEDKCDVFAVPGERDSGPRGSDPYKDSAWERRCDITAGVTEFDSCNFDGLKDCDLAECPRGTPVDCLDGANPSEWVFEGLNPYDDNGNHSLGIHGAFCLDIKPGSCPNSFNRGSHGVLPVAIASPEGFDATMVDTSSVRLWRADGIGGEVAPNQGPPGPHPEFQDVATPFGGQPCECLDLTGDGIDDVSLHFKTDDVVSALGLGDLPSGDLVELAVSGTLLDGTAFTSAGDCLRLVPPGTAGVVLAVEASVPGAWIGVDPLDETLDGGGFADFVRTMPLTTVVTLTAEEWAEGRPLRGWQIGGLLHHMGQTSVEFVVDQDMTVSAVYGPTTGSGSPKPPGEMDPDGMAPESFIEGQSAEAGTIDRR